MKLPAKSQGRRRVAVNARDAMPQGGRLTIETSEVILNQNDARLELETPPGHYACLSVGDTGTGIRPEVLPRIFEPFITTKAAGKGTGLILATVFGITKQHQGWIRVDNQPGQGVTFQIFLPVCSSPAPEPAPAKPKPKPAGGTETLLLVEDEPTIRKLTRIMLARQGYTILEADNGLEALKLWETHRETVALLLTDRVMPGGLGGQELARRLKAAQAKLKVVLPAVPVLKSRVRNFT